MLSICSDSLDLSSEAQVEEGSFLLWRIQRPDAESRMPRSTLRGGGYSWVSRVIAE